MSDTTTSAIVPIWTFTDRLRKSREVAGLRQADMAERLVKSRTAITGWEKGEHRPDELALRAWAHETGVPVEWLKHGIEPTTPGEAIEPGVTIRYPPVAAVTELRFAA